MIIKGASCHPEMMKKKCFKIIGNFSENAFIENPSKISHSANIRRFIVFSFFFFFFSNLLHHEDHMSTEMC